MYQAYIYGAGYEYDRLMAKLPFYSNIIQVQKIILTEKYASSIDGYEVIEPQEMKMENVDFIIIAVENWKEIYKTLVDIYGSEIEDKVIRSKIFDIPFLQLNQYFSIKQKGITILANSCIGGRIYNKLGLKVLSPTKNMYCLGKDFREFCNNLEEYIECEMLEYLGGGEPNYKRMKE